MDESGEAQRERGRLLRHAERKHVTILFADIKGSTELIQSLDPEEGAELLEPILETMQAAVRDNGGTVLAIEGDGVMAIFGAPLAAEDHALRACRAAQRILDSIRATGAQQIPVRIGIDTGEIVLQSVSDGIAFEYRASGKLTHLAHRLQEVAEAGTAFLSLPTLRLAGPGVKANWRGPLRLKGFDTPVEAFVLEEVLDLTSWDRRRTARSLTRFVGRVAERRVLDEAARRAAGGVCSVVAINGDAGMGKSRLVHDLQSRLEADGWRIASVAGSSTSSERAFGAASNLVRSMTGVAQDDAPGIVQERLRDTLDGLRDLDAEQVAALEVLLDLAAQTTGWAETAPQLRKERLVTAVRSLVMCTASRSPTAVLIEDMHWVDQESADLFGEIVAEGGNTSLLMVVTGRPEWAPEWTRHAHVTTFRLSPLPEADARELLSDVLGKSAGISALAHRVIDHSEGVPLFLEEMARHLIERGVMVPERGKLLLRPPVEDIEIPDTVLAILEARINRLRAEERALLQLASVIGRKVPLPVLAAVAGLPAKTLQQLLATLEQLLFLQRELGASTTYVFTHALTQTAAYGGILVRRRRELHRRVLAAIEQVYPDRLGDVTEVLAGHAFSGESWEKSASYCLLAGKAANDFGAHRAAIPFFERALASLERLPQSEQAARQGIAVRMGLRVALASTADLGRISQCLAEADELADRIGDQREMIKIRSSSCTVFTVLGDLREAIAAGEWAYTASGVLGADSLRMGAAFALAQALFLSGELRRAEAIILEHAALWSGPLRRMRTDTTGTLSVLILTTLTIVRTLLGDRAGATEAAQDATAIAAETVLAYDLSYARLGEGLAALANDRPQHAAFALDEALRYCRSARLEILFPSVSRFLGQSYVAVGRAAEAVPIMTEAMLIARSRKLHLFYAWCGVTLGDALLRAGSGDQARDVALETVQLSRERGLLPILAQGLRLLGDVTVEVGPDRAVAVPYYEEAAELAGRLGMRPDVQRCRLALDTLCHRDENSSIVARS
ncbi:MAG: adenylate/guanylate cyclase domain-containing protein [Acetobacteraceae bacterium]|nr:adenylate/guanylate cyclase domain-containing protein [Acetobacteraceae bacterium]